MFTIHQLQTAHAKVKSGADFPAYIREIHTLGVTHYETFVSDGHTDFYGKDSHKVIQPPKYGLQKLADHVDATTFRAQLLAHQQGKTDFPAFIKMCAATGIRKWQVNLGDMTCTYFDNGGNAILVEMIPQQA